jgi:rod shape determining protein RodA
MRSLLSRRFDWYLLALVLALSLFGVLMVASALAGNTLYASWPWRQAGFLVVGLILLFVTAAVDYRLLESLAYPIYTVFLAFLAIIAVIGTVAGGAQRWLKLGEFFLQPSELTKLAAILALAHYLAAREERMESFLTPLGALLLLTPAVVLIYLQPSLGTALSIVVIGGVMLVMGGLRLRHALVLAGAAIGGMILAWQFVLQDYMKDRVFMLVDPSRVKPEDLYNIKQAIIGIGSGGWLGRGLFRGSQSQLHFLRVRHSDFIFSVTAEELGFIGAALLIVLFALLLFRLVRIAGLARDTFGMLIVVGVTTMILFQLVINIGMNLNIVPVAGIPLPFISYGGSSLWTMLIGIGLAESVMLRHKKIGFDR